MTCATCGITLNPAHGDVFVGDDGETYCADHYPERPDEPLEVLDLYAGLEGWADGFRRRGHNVTTLDIDPVFSNTITADVLRVTVDQLGGPGAYDVVVASPPCEGFAVGSIGKHWDLPGGRGSKAVPKSDGARLGLRLAHRTAELIRELAPTHGFAIENPTGMMRHVFGFHGPTTVEGLTVYRWLHPLDRAGGDAGKRAPSVTYCRLGFHYRKPTDLWCGGPLVNYLDLPAPCKTYPGVAEIPDGKTNPYRRDSRSGELCHEVAERGARTGVQGLDSYAERSLVPTDLSARFAAAAEATGLPRVGRSPDLDPAIRGHRQDTLL